MSKQLRKWEQDYDYKQKLSKEEKAWLKQFNGEYYLNQGLKSASPIHTTEEQRKDCYNRHNSAYRDVLNMAVCGSRIDSIDALNAEGETLNQISDNHCQDALINLLDRVRK